VGASRAPGPIERFGALLFAAALAAGSNVARGAPPLIRFDPGRHTAAVTSFALDPTRQYVFSGSKDGTVRMWSLHHRRLEATIFMPEMLENVNVIAVSRDGRWLAAGFAYDRICVFELESKQLHRCMEAVSRPTALVFAHDGSVLYAGMQRGIAIFDLASGDELKMRGNGTVNGLALTADGKLLVSNGPNLELLDRELNVLATHSSNACRGPGIVRIAASKPARIALACEQRPAILLLEPSDLSQIAKLDPPRKSDADGQQMILEFSDDGSLLYAAESEYNGPTYFQVWSRGGRGAMQAIDAGKDAITALGALPSGELAVGFDSGAWGVLNADRQLALVAAGGPARVSGQVAMLIDPETAGVELRFEGEGGPRSVRFSPRTATFALDPPADPRFIPSEKLRMSAGWAILPHGGIAVRWFGDYVRWLDYAGDETLLSLAVAPNARGWIAYTPRGEHAAGGERFWVWYRPRGSTIVPEVLLPKGAELTALERPEAIRAALDAAVSARYAAVAPPPALVPRARAHAGSVTVAALDPLGRWLVTGSEDRTLRIWPLRGEGDEVIVPLPRLRFRLGENEQIRAPWGLDSEGMPIPGTARLAGLETGRIHALAISPDGARLAVGGTTWDARLRPVVYIFDPRTPRTIEKTIVVGPPDSRVKHLCFSADGTRFLAVIAKGAEDIPNVCTLAGECRAIPEQEGAERPSTIYGGPGNPDYRTDAITAVAADARNRFWLARGRFVVRAEPPFEGVRAWPVFQYTDESIRILRPSPDASRIAVGRVVTNRRARSDGTSTRIDVRSAEDFSLIHRARDIGVENGTLDIAGWSADGSVLCAGGTWRQAGRRAIRCWSKGGSAEPNDFAGAARPLVFVGFLPDNTAAYVAEDSTWGLFAPGGDSTQRHEGRRDSFIAIDSEESINASDNRLFASGSGDTVSLLTGEPRELISFSVSARAVAVEPASAAERYSATRWAPERFADLVWDRVRNRAPSSGLPVCRSTSPDRQWMVFGTIYGSEARLASVALSGVHRWVTDLPIAPTALAVSGDSRFIIAALRDGSIRWYRASDGSELLALSLLADRRWVLWTPAGDYDASIGGDELVAWQLDEGPERLPGIVPLAQFTPRPAMISNVLAPAEPGAPVDDVRARELEQLRALLPPVVEIISPAEGDTIAKPDLKLEVAIRSPSGLPITEISVLVDGARVLRAKPPANARGPSIRMPLEVRIPPRDVRVSVLARTERGSGDTVRSLSWSGPVATAAEDTRMPTLRLLAVGVSRYASSPLNLKYAADDARGFAALLASQPAGVLYEAVDARVLVDQEATRANVLRELDALRARTEPRDVAILFLSGHGANERDTDAYHFLPHDADSRSFADTMISGEEIIFRMSNLGVRRMVFLDTCDSGNVLGAQSRGGIVLAATVNEMTRAEHGLIVFTASGESQAALERRDWGAGAFTKALLEGLRGGARSADRRYVTSLSLLDYTENRVHELTHGLQEPLLVVPATVIRSFPIAAPPP
jgi:WD40 repeat protein